MKAQKCPVCDGRGKLPAEFYPDTAYSSERWVECRSCQGTGIVAVEDTTEMILKGIEEKLVEGYKESKEAEAMAEAEAEAMAEAEAEIEKLKAEAEAEEQAQAEYEAEIEIF